MFHFDPFSPEIDADPFPAYRRLRDEFPCFWSEEANAWILSRFARSPSPAKRGAARQRGGGGRRRDSARPARRASNRRPPSHRSQFLIDISMMTGAARRFVDGREDQYVDRFRDLKAAFRA